MSFSWNSSDFTMAFKGTNDNWAVSCWVCISIRSGRVHFLRNWLIFIKKVFPSSKLKRLLRFKQFPAELHVSFASLLSIHSVISSTLYDSSLNFAYSCWSGALCWDKLWTLFKQKERMWWQPMCCSWCHLKYKDKGRTGKSCIILKKGKNEAQSSYTGKMSQWNCNLDFFTLASTFASSNHLVAPLWRRLYFWALSNGRCYSDSKGKEGRSESKEACALSLSRSQAHSSMAVTDWTALW